MCNEEEIKKTFVKEHQLKDGRIATETVTYTITPKKKTE